MLHPGLNLLLQLRVGEIRRERSRLIGGIDDTLRDLASRVRVRAHRELRTCRDLAQVTRRQVDIQRVLRDLRDKAVRADAERSGVDGFGWLMADRTVGLGC